MWVHSPIILKDHTFLSLKSYVNKFFFKALNAWTKSFKGTFTIDSGQRSSNQACLPECLPSSQRKFMW